MTADFEEALDKILLGTTRGGLMNAQEREVVAYHEAGHALVAHFTPGSDPLRKVTIVPRGRAARRDRCTMPEEDRHNYSRTYLLGRLAMALGGRAAEMIVYDEVTTGAESDLKEATALARRMVGIWGMSDEVGAGLPGRRRGARLPWARDHPGQGLLRPTAQRLDKAVREMVEGALSRALDLNRRYRRQLDALVAALLERETLDLSEVQEIFGPADAPGDDPEVGISPQQPATRQQGATPVSTGATTIGSGAGAPSNLGQPAGNQSAEPKLVRLLTSIQFILTRRPPVFRRAALSFTGSSCDYIDDRVALHQDARIQVSGEVAGPRVNAPSGKQVGWEPYADISCIEPRIRNPRA